MPTRTGWHDPALEDGYRLTFGQPEIGCDSIEAGDVPLQSAARLAVFLLKRAEELAQRTGWSWRRRIVRPRSAADSGSRVPLA